MRAVIQRVSNASVVVGNETVGAIGNGVIVYLGAYKEDSHKDVEWTVNKVASLRIFPDESGKMSLSVSDVAGSVLLVSQFTLFGDVRRGRRPSFDAAAEPALAQTLYEKVCEQLRSTGLRVETGRFRTKMSVRVEVDGPVTIMMDSRKQF